MNINKRDRIKEIEQMEVDIKCGECGKGTLHFELGQVYYNIHNPSETIIVKKKIICPKCKADISDGKCLVKRNYFLMSLVAVNVLSMGKEEGSSAVPKHLRGAHPLRKKEYDIMVPLCKTRLLMVEKF